MAIPGQKKERVWHDPDEVKAIGLREFIRIYPRHFSGKFFLLGIVMYLFLHTVTKEPPITVIGVIVMLVVSALMSPLLEILYRETFEKDK